MLILLDLSTAFDTEDHKMLIERLHEIGICDYSHSSQVILV